MRSDYLTCEDHVELATESDTHGDVALGAYLRRSYRNHPAALVHVRQSYRHASQ